MREITGTDYKQFLQSHSEVQIGETKIKLHNNWKIHNFAPSTFTPETTTIWSFPDRGDWTKHVHNYRGNWSPYIPRNLILRYTAPGDLVLDQRQAPGILPWSASSLYGALWLWISIPMPSCGEKQAGFVLERWDLKYKMHEIKNHRERKGTQR